MTCYERLDSVVIQDQIDKMQLDRPLTGPFGFGDCDCLLDKRSNSPYPYFSHHLIYPRSDSFENAVMTGETCRALAASNEA